MSINASNYIVSYNLPNPPRINVNVRTVTGEELDSAISAYMSSASSYSENYRTMVQDKMYVEDRLKKDLCGSFEGLTSGGIDYENNTITYHVKADEVYGYATSNVSLTTIGSINGVVTKFGNFYSAYYQDDEHTSCILQEAYETTMVYDERAFAFSTTVSTIESGSVFVLDAPNAKGSNCTFTNYVGNDPQYKIAYDASYTVSGASVGAWVVKTVPGEGEEATDVAYAIGNVPTSNMNWTIVGE